MCTCSSCTFTDSFSGKGFAAWPKGEPKGPRKSEAEYRAHVAYAFKDSRRKVDFGPVGAGFYGGGKRAAEVLAHTFRPGQREPEWLEFDYANQPTERAFPALLSPLAGLNPTW